MRTTATFHVAILLELSQAGDLLLLNFRADLEDVDALVFLFDVLVDADLDDGTLLYPLLVQVGLVSDLPLDVPLANRLSPSGAGLYSNRSQSDVVLDLPVPGGPATADEP